MVWNMQEGKLKLVRKLCFATMRRRLTNKIEIVSLLAISSLLIAACAPFPESDRAIRPARKMRVVYCTQSFPVGARIDTNSVYTQFIEGSKRPQSTLYDPWIAIGRVAIKPLKAKEPILFSQVLSKELMNSTNLEYVAKLQDSSYLYTERADRDLSELIPIVRSLKEIPSGALIAPTDLTIERIAESKCPSDALGDIWIAAGRRPNQPIRTGEIVYYHQVIPKEDWQQWIRGNAPIDRKAI